MRCSTPPQSQNRWRFYKYERILLTIQSVLEELAMDEAHKEFAGIDVPESPHKMMELLIQLCEHFGFGKLKEQFASQTLYSPANDYTTQSELRKFCTHCGDKKVGFVQANSMEGSGRSPASSVCVSLQSVSGRVQEKSLEAGRRSRCGMQLLRRRRKRRALRFLLALDLQQLHYAPYGCR